MELLYARCAGLDVHAKTVVACARIASGGAVTYHHRTVATTTQGLIELVDWLAAHGCTHVAMESTGVYWKPVWHMLEGQFELTLANALHVRNVPGRKSDMKDARWLLKASRAQLVEVLRGRVTAHHRFMITLHLTQIEALETAVTTIEARIGDALAPFRAALNLLTTMPGLSETAAAVILAEIGDNVSPFPTAGHLVSWAGLCPRLDESAGKRRSTRTRQGPRGSRQRSYKPPGPPRVEKTATSTRSFCGSRAAGGPRRRSSPWPPPCSPTSITCSVTAWNSTTSVLSISCSATATKNV